MMSLWKRTTKRLMHVATYTWYGWNQGSNSYTSSRWNPQKNIYNISTKTSRVKIQIYIQRSKSYIKQNSFQVRTRIQMGLRGLKITMASITLPRPSRKGNLANVVASMYLSSNLLRRKSETSSSKYEVLSKTSRRIKHSQQVAFVREVRRQARETQKDVSCMVGLSGSEQALKNL
jgi:hypothetical protein